MSKNQNAVAVAPTSTALLADVPDFLRDKIGGEGRGSENVGAEDLVIPRLELVQSLSPCRKPSEPDYIEGASEGMMYNNVTRQLYKDGALIIPVFFRKEFLIWKDRKKGGGFRGAFPTELQAAQALESLEDGADCEVMDTAQHFCLIVEPETGKAEEIVLSMSRSKMKVSRNFNSLIRINGGDSFTRVYRVSGVLEKNANNEDYYNFKIGAAGFPTKELYERAEKLYDIVKSGKAVASREEEAVTSPASGGNGEY